MTWQKSAPGASALLDAEASEPPALLWPNAALVCYVFPSWFITTSLKFIFDAVRDGVGPHYVSEMFRTAQFAFHIHHSAAGLPRQTHTKYSVRGGSQPNSRKRVLI